jgi:hypothetical protein
MPCAAFATISFRRRHYAIDCRHFAAFLSLFSFTLHFHFSPISLADAIIFFRFHTPPISRMIAAVAARRMRYGAGAAFTTPIITLMPFRRFSIFD